MTVKILRKIVLMTSTLLSLSISVFGGIHTFVEKSILSEGNDWVRISVDRTGVCKITYAMLVNWGIKNPEKAHVFGYGGAMLKESFMLSKKDDLPQVPVWIEKGNDGIFNEGDYILFYAQGPVSWEYNSTRKVFQHTENPYSDLGYYLFHLRQERMFISTITLKNKQKDPYPSGHRNFWIMQSMKLIHQSPLPLGVRGMARVLRMLRNVISHSNSQT